MGVGGGGGKAYMRGDGQRKERREDKREKKRRHPIEIRHPFY